MAERIKDVSDGELAVLEVLWRGSSAIRHVADGANPGRIDDTLRDGSEAARAAGGQGYVVRDRSLHVHLFSAAVQREELIGRRVRALVNKLCGGSLVPLLSHLAGRELSAAERRALRSW